MHVYNPGTIWKLYEATLHLKMEADFTEIKARQYTKRGYCPGCCKNHSGGGEVMLGIELCVETIAQLGEIACGQCIAITLIPQQLVAFVARYMQLVDQYAMQIMDNIVADELCTEY